MSLIIIKQYKNRDVKVTLPNHSQLVSKEKTDNSTFNNVKSLSHFKTSCPKHQF